MTTAAAAASMNTATAKVSIKYEELRKLWFLCECAGSYIKSNKSFHIKTKKHQQFLKLQAKHPNVTIIHEKVQELVNNYHNNIRRMTHGLTCYFAAGSADSCPTCAFRHRDRVAPSGEW